MTEDEGILLNKVIGIFLCLCLVVTAAILVLPQHALALKIGETPTPTPTPPTPTPQIIYRTILVTPIPTPTPVPTVLPGKGLTEINNQIYVYQKTEGSPGITFVARGDGAIISRQYPNYTNGTWSEAHFWMFGGVGTNDQMLDHEVVVDYEGKYHVYLSALETSGLSPGTYTALVQFAGRNGKMDVKYDENNQRFDSIYTAVASSSVLGDTPGKFYQKFRWMLDDSGWCDDTYEEFIVVVEDPWVSIDEVYSDSDTNIVYIQGATNLATRNELLLTLDPNNIITEKDRELSTKKLDIEPYVDYNYPRNLWRLNFSTDGMFPGKHEFFVESPKFKSSAESFFTIVEEWPRPTVTPTPKRYVTGFPTTYPTQTTPTPFAPPPVVTYTPEPEPPTESYVSVGTDTTEVAMTLTVVPRVTKTKAILLNANASSPIGRSLKAMPMDPVIVIIGLFGALFLVMRRK